MCIFETMDIKAEKLNLIQYITQIDDSKIIERLKQFVKANEDDFWNDLDEDQKQEIKQGVDELNRGEKFNYEDVISSHR
jgi:hypothetical protein